MSIHRLLTTVAFALLVTACGGGNPGSPSGGGSGSGSTGGSGSGGTGTSTRNLSVTIDGQAFTPNAVTAARSNPGFEIVTVVGSRTDGSTVSFTAPTTVGVHNVNATVTDRGSGNLTLISGGTGTAYLAFLTQGSGSVTLTSITSTSVTGRVDLVMAPTSGIGNNRVVTGTFDVAF